MRQLHIELNLPEEFASIKKHLVANVSEYGKLTRGKINQYVVLSYDTFYEEKDDDERQHSLWFDDIDPDMRYVVEVIVNAPDEEQGRLHWRGCYVVVNDLWESRREIFWEEFHFYEIVCG